MDKIIKHNQAQENIGYIVSFAADLTDFAADLTDLSDFYIGCPDLEDEQNRNQKLNFSSEKCKQFYGQLTKLEKLAGDIFGE